MYRVHTHMWMREKEKKMCALHSPVHHANLHTREQMTEKQNS